MSSSVINTFLSFILQTWYIWALIICFAILKLFVPIIKGALGEFTVRIALRALNPKEYTVIHDVIVEANERLTQIDHIVVAKTGIYVIETKNYKGLITGYENAATWTQHLHKKKINFHNPIRQNYGHIKSLSTVLNLPESKFISIIAFDPDATVKVQTSTPVLYYSMLAKSISGSTSEILTQEEKDQIETKIIDIKQSNKKLRKKHIEQIKKRTAVGS